MTLKQLVCVEHKYDILAGLSVFKVIDLFFYI